MTQSRTILIVDDEFGEIHRIASFMLQAYPHYMLLNAPNGKLGLQLALAHAPQLILTDWDMPEMSGIELTRQVKANKTTKDIPVILITGTMTTSEDLKIALDAGTIDYIRKPLDFVELEARMNTALRIYDAQQEIRQQNITIQKFMETERNRMEAEKNRMQKEIEKKNRQLSSATMLATTKSKLLAQLEETINKIAPNLSSYPDDLQALKNLKKSIKDQLQLDSSWDDFKIHFEDVHPSFFSKLQHIDTSLTVQDLKLSAYLKVGLDTKEIAQLLNITPASVRTSIYRMKKKLGLGEEENLREFVYNIN